MRMMAALGVAAAISLIGVGFAKAGANKTWVAAEGVDTGPCSYAAPCKTFQYAHDQTNSGGEIDVKNSGAYGTLTITKAISVLAEGVLATINVPSGSTGIKVLAGASDTIVLHGLSIDGHTIDGTSGIWVISAQIVTIDHCSVRNAGGSGIQISNKSTMILNNLISGNFSGVYMNNGSIAIIGNNAIVGNQLGINVSNQNKIYSYGDNAINGNIECDTCGNTVAAARQ